ncbi:MAG: YheC/YheD family protein [Bacillus sp. (in: Bacteria)]|nr:YheC/YheD family protein [Bacillus sp. (in: firmicutes)]
MGFVLPYAKDNKLFKGYYWNDRTREWQEVICPKPHAVYNRYPLRGDNGEDDLLVYLQTLKRWSVPIFNSSFFHKGRIGKLFQEDLWLKNYFPTTIELKNSRQLYRFLERYPTAYLKDVDGAQGFGIWKLERNGEHYSLHSQQKIYTDLTFTQLVYLLSKLLKEKDLLLQEGIRGAMVNETAYDFRVLMVYHDSDWKMVGTGVRAAVHGGYTTHVPQGGAVLSLQEIPTRPRKASVIRLGKKIGKRLREEYGEINEFSFDLIVDNQGSLWVVDVNSKPMTFDEREIQGKRVEMLTRMLVEGKFAANLT